MSVPISATSCSAACGPMASIWLKSAPPVSRCNGVRMSKWGAWWLAVGLRRGGGSFAARVAMGGQLLRVVHSGQNAADDVEAGAAGKIGDHGVELKIHLGQCLLHPLYAGCSLFD